MDGELSPQDKKDLDKFIKFFALKVQIKYSLSMLAEKWLQFSQFKQEPVLGV